MKKAWVIKRFRSRLGFDSHFQMVVVGYPSNLFFHFCFCPVGLCLLVALL